MHLRTSTCLSLTLTHVQGNGGIGTGYVTPAERTSHACANAWKQQRREAAPNERWALVVHACGCATLAWDLEVQSGA